MEVVIHIQIITDFEVLTRALTELVTSFGFTAHTQDSPEVEVALAYLTRTAPPYPAPAAVPTLALFSGGEDEVIRLLQRGYRGYLGPTDPLSRLKLALEALRRGEIWASRELLTRTLGTLAAPSLTEREQEVLQLLAGGLSNRTIAVRLGISERTVKAHVSNLFDKHGVRNRTELALLV